MRLDPQSEALLREVLDARASPSVSSLKIKNILGGPRLSEEEVDAICQILTDELIRTGLGVDDEPNERGLRLERLLDHVNRERIRTGRP